MPPIVKDFSNIILSHNEEFTLNDLISMLSQLYKKNNKK